MIDLHTHILYGMDDGALSAEESIQLLRMQRDQGVTNVVLTPHFYREKQTEEEFLRKRARMFNRLQEHLQKLDASERESLPRMTLGAEVAWYPNMAGWENLESLCIEGTRNMLLELPFQPWDNGISNQLYDFISRTGITPVLVHLERYMPKQKRKRIEEVLEMRLPIQISSGAFLNSLSRGAALRAIKHGWAHIVATDCHDPEKRPPNLKLAMDIIKKRLGDEAVQRINRFNEAVLEA